MKHVHGAHLHQGTISTDCPKELAAQSKLTQAKETLKKTGLGGQHNTEANVSELLPQPADADFK